MDVLGLMLAGIALVLGFGAGEWVFYRTRKKIIAWPVGIVVFIVSLVVLHRLI